MVGILPDDVVFEGGLAVGVPDMRAERPVDDDIVGDCAEVTFTEFDAPGEAEVIGDQIVAGAIIQVDIPTVIAAEAVVLDGYGFLAFPFGHVGVLGNPLLGYGPVRMPEPVSSPAVEGAVVTGFEDRIKHVIPLDEVASERAVTDIDAGARAFVDGAVAYSDGVGHGDIDAGGLLFNPAGCDDQAVFDEAGYGEVV